MKKLTLAATILCALTAAGTANAYQAEVTGGFGITDIDIAGADDAEAFGVQGKIFLNDVSTANGPLAEAAFLDRASNLSINYDRVELGPVKTDTIYAGVEYFAQSGLYVNAKIGQTTIDSVDVDATVYSAELGYIPTDGLLVAIGLVGADSDVADNIDPTLRVKYVAPVGAGDIGVEAYLGLGDIDTQTLAVDYYFDKTVSAGFDVSNNNELDTKTYGINAKKFFGEQFNIGARVGFGEVSGIDTVTYGATAQYRW